MHCIFSLRSFASEPIVCIMNAPLKFFRRIGPDPHANGAQTIALQNCPDVWELECGNFAIIGIDITDAAKPKLPPSAGCGPDGRVVFIPRNLLVNAKSAIPDNV